MIRKEIDDLRTALARALNHIYVGKLCSDSWGSEFSWSQATLMLERVEAETLKVDIRSLSKQELEGARLHEVLRKQLLRSSLLPQGGCPAVLAQVMVGEIRGVKK